MYRIIFNTAIADKEIGEAPADDVKLAIEELENHATHKFGGYTLIKAQGGYLYEDGKKAEYGIDTYIFEITTDKLPTAVKSFAKKIGKIFSQESVAFQQITGKSDLVFIK